ncbi:DUF1302 domain-containing protein [Sinimarinibacterium sp. CAU 1509]|uniref:DUF1302 family protein n=1 Tax=Sinimarinibacterium sp. CAU 1509 TaxID=2562283 RepID=UPI0010AC57CA|nr:DUF1302 family protein [Sinimarinibacterium sp. CAU 1509]TJY64794.1 DUF1302 domain-containing protein [Sinimarinibacterium sp. CAU 1509]
MQSKVLRIFAVAAGVAGGVPLSASAFEYNFSLFDQDVTSVVNNTATLGASWRIEGRDDYLVGKSNLDPSVCGGVYQSCQGVHRQQSYPAAHLAAAPGMASVNFDDGNLNYDKWDVTQAPFKLANDLNIRFGDFGIFVRGLGIYDYVNYNDFEEYHPNRITADNAADVGTTDDPQFSNRYYAQVYGPGGVVRNERTDNTALRQAGLRYDLLDANIYGSFFYTDDRQMLFRVGRQTVNWGESTVAVINSVNQAQPVNANSLYRLGFGLLEELFLPVGMARISAEVMDGLSVEGYYQWEWEPIEIPTPGTYMSFLDLGTDNLVNNVNLAFGGGAEDPDSVGTLLDTPLAGITPTTLTGERLRDNEARDSGQYGVAFKYYSDAINNGTEFGFYFMNYHSKLPYASFYSSDASCARREGNAEGVDARNSLELLRVCPNLPISQAQARNAFIADTLALTAAHPGVLADLGPVDNLSTILASLNSLLVYDPSQPFADMVPIDTVKIQLEYPEDLKMFGFSFNTTAGDYSFQGEMSYRPNVPLQVSLVDLAFAALGPALTRCHNESLECNGSTASRGFTEDGQYTFYDSNDFTDANGNNPYPDTVNLVIGSAPGSARSFPNFIIPYRGGTVGENAPNSYIQGWIPGKVAQYNLGATRVLGSSENWIGADQIILLYELAATHVLNMPDFDELQIEGPYTATTSASAGADGSGADGSRLACSTNPSCTIGPDGLRFNPFQAPRKAFADAFSWGYRVVGRISYESVLPGISIQPLFIWMQDIHGNSPGPAGNFVEGRKSLNFLLETRYEKSFAFTVSYNMFTGAGHNNLYADRDNLGFFVKYQF